MFTFNYAAMDKACGVVVAVSFTPTHSFLHNPIQGMAVDRKRGEAEKKTMNQALANMVKLGMCLSASILKSGNHLNEIHL